MLRRELGTHLTGRYLQVELYPFSFKEFLDFKNYKPTQKELYTTIGKAQILNHFKQYMYNGGFPKYLQEQSKQYLSSLYQIQKHVDEKYEDYLTHLNATT